MSDKFDSLHRRLDRVEAQIQQPLVQGPHEFKMELFTSEEQQTLAAFLAEIRDAGSLNKLSDEQLLIPA